MSSFSRSKITSTRRPTLASVYGASRRLPASSAPGALLASNLLEAPYTEAKVGRRVEVVFERLNDDVTLPQFRLARDAQ